MNCESFVQLTSPERVQLVGKIIHLVQSDETVFLIASELVEKADFEGVFDKIKILPVD